MRYFILIIVLVFALCERKNKNNESGSTMLPPVLRLPQGRLEQLSGATA